MLDGLVDDAASALRWSAAIVDVASGEYVADRDADRALPTASVGKILLLMEVARRLDSGEFSPDVLLSRAGHGVADSGLWQHLDVRELSVADACRLVGAVSDNLATNVLLDQVGLAAVEALARRCGLLDTALLDRVRDERGPQHPPELSRGTARELARLAAQLDRGDVVAPAPDRAVTDWLALGTDLSMVASAFGLDPLAHSHDDRGMRLWNKTGTDRGIRADVGVVRVDERALAYAVIAAWDGTDATRDAVLAAMRGVGESLRAHVHVGTRT